MYLVTVIQHQFGSATSETRNREKRRHGLSCHALLQYTISLEKCCFVMMFSSILLFFFFFSGLNIAYQINPYIEWSLEYISIQPFHFFK